MISLYERPGVENDKGKMISLLQTLTSTTLRLWSLAHSWIVSLIVMNTICLNRHWWQKWIYCLKIQTVLISSLNATVFYRRISCTVPYLKDVNWPQEILWIFSNAWMSNWLRSRVPGHTAWKKWVLPQYCSCNKSLLEQHYIPMGDT